MQRALSATNISSLLNSPQPQQRPQSYHEANGAGMASAIVSLPPLSSMSDLTGEHRPELPRPYKCPLCDKAFHRLEHQTRHIRTHTGEKPHACQFPGCSKRFSRSDELTRHSRIHTNPNSRRSTKQHQAAAAAAAAAAVQAAHHEIPAAPNGISAAQMMPPPPKSMSKSAPSSHVGSPNVSPPHHYVPSLHSGLTPYSRSHSGTHLSGHNKALDINVLAMAAHHLERDHRMPVFGNHLYAPYSQSSRLPPISFPSSPSSSQPMSRSHSHEDEDQYHHHRPVKRSRPGSPVSTAPSSPSFSHDSCSPTPDHTPLATPAHSPRLYAREPSQKDYGLPLPSIRSLSLRPVPHLPAMEIDPATPVYNSTNRFSDIINRNDAMQRKLPAPNVTRVAVHDLLNGSSGLSGTSSASGSVAGSD